MTKLLSDVRLSLLIVLFGILASLLAWIFTPVVAAQFFHPWVYSAASAQTIAGQLAGLILAATAVIAALWWLAGRGLSRRVKAAPEPSKSTYQIYGSRSPEELMAEFYEEQRTRSALRQRTSSEQQHDEPHESHEAREQLGRQAFATRLAAVEKQVLRAYTRASVDADVFGETSEQERLRAFAKVLPTLGIADLGVLGASQNRTALALFQQLQNVPSLSWRDYCPAYRGAPLPNTNDNPPAIPFLRGYKAE